MIKNIVFDMGNVLLYFRPETFIEKAGVSDPADQKLLLNEIYRSSEWVQTDRGTLSPEKAEKIFCSRLPERLHFAVNRLLLGWDRPILPVPGMQELLRELKQNGYKLYLLSNASSHQPDYWSRIPGSDLFDGSLISYEVRLLKPEQEIFRVFCKRFSLKPEECVFVDDYPANIEGAQFFGMAGIVFHDDIKELRKKLADCGVQVANAE